MSDPHLRHAPVGHCGRAPPLRLTGRRGQASVEFALVLPLVAIAALALVQVGVSIRNQVAVEVAAREGARAASVSAEPAASAARAAARATTLPVSVSTSVGSQAVTVTVRFVDDVSIPVLGRFIGPVEHRAVAHMQREPPEP